MSGIGKRIIYISEDIIDLVPAYLEARNADPAMITKALSAGDFELIYSVGHKLKGVAASYGFPELSVIGAKLEAAAESKKAAEISALVKQIETYLAGIEIQPEKAA